MIKIMKASAGSGKTWNLARQYIRLLLERKDPYSYRHILAVTFTNKATDEMKERILNELHLLATSPSRSGYFDDFVPSLYPDARSLAEAAGLLLCNILHDYSAFAVSTIDSFFQHTLKAFAKEIGYFSSYAIELDKESLIRESVDRFLDSLTESEIHSRSLEWMTRKTMSQLEDGEGFKLDYTLKKIAERFNSEEFRLAVERSGVDENSLYSDERLMNLENGCSRICSDYVSMLSAAASAVIQAFDAAGVDPYDTTRHFMSNTLNKYKDLKEGAFIPVPTDSFRRSAADISLWFPKAKKHLEGMVTEEILDSLSRFISLFDIEFKVYNTAMHLKKQIYGFAVASDLYENFMSILKEKNVLTIDRTNTMLRQIIDGSDTPFIYEKLGVRYDNFLLDEFQDTSQVQWDNFRPLLQNSVAGGHENLIVGDVKQSIYRWRQSEWDLLESKVQEQFPDSTRVSTLDSNFRSCTEIVSFNNAYFKAVAEYLVGRYGSGGEVIDRIYSDVEQKIRRAGNGMVDFRFRPDSNIHEAVLGAVQEAVADGFELGDITILVRLNKEGGEIAEYLVSQGIPVISDDSLKVSSSLTVRRLVSLMAGIENPEDSMSCYLATSLGIEIPQKWFSLVELAESLLRLLSEADSKAYEEDTLYIQSFMDLLHDYVVAEGDNLRGFLKKWADDKSNISSPRAMDAVRIMTVHKSKGLDFPYVIFPSLDAVGFYSFTDRWSSPQVDGTSLEGVADGVYDVYLSSRSEDTLFDNCYKEEKLKQYIDNLNILYVAFTRASHAMTVISSLPSSVEGDFKDFNQWTYSYLYNNCDQLGFEHVVEDNGGEMFRTGVMSAPVHAEGKEDIPMPSSFVSWPLDSERGRLKFTSDASDFFSDDGQIGMSSSNRIRGVILHEILSRVVLPEDLASSVLESVVSGILTSEEASAVEKMLSESIENVRSLGWFPDRRDDVLNETSIIDTDGRIYRPDRVIKDGDKVIVVDFKFGCHDDRYVSQVNRYARLWRRMGYGDVSGFLWYPDTGEIVKVC